MKSPILEDASTEAQTPAKNIILVGMMGSGKSTVGRDLADWLGYRLVDIDANIEYETKRHITEIFQKEGEAFFRDLEHDAIKQAVSNDRSIIATGGGAFTIERNRAILLSSGMVFYLQASADDLYERVKHAKNRPLLHSPTPLQTMRDLLAAREPAYELAHHTVPVGHTDCQAIVQHIISLYRNEPNH